MAAPDGRRGFRFGSALGWSVTWALGVAAGVAIGGWLTLVGGAGAPGVVGLDPVSDLVVLPGAVFVAVLLLQLLGRWIAALVPTASGGRQHKHDE